MNIGAEHLPLSGKINPQSVAAAANAASGWIDAGAAPDWLTVMNLGALGGGTVTLSFEQANTSVGGGAKALSAWTGTSSATDNATAMVNNDAGLLDHANGFRWFRAKLANVGGTGALLSATVHANQPRYRS
jgi:hypothetical protein